MGDTDKGIIDGIRLLADGQFNVLTYQRRTILNHRIKCHSSFTLKLQPNILSYQNRDADNKDDRLTCLCNSNSSSQTCGCKYTCITKHTREPTFMKHLL